MDYRRPRSYLDYIGVSTGPMGETGPIEPGYIGGGMTGRGGTNTATVVVLDSEDIDADLAKVKERGGEVVAEKYSVGDMGYVGYFKDTESNVVGLWQNALRTASLGRGSTRRGPPLPSH